MAIALQLQHKPEDNNWNLKTCIKNCDRNMKGSISMAGCASNIRTTYK